MSAEALRPSVQISSAFQTVGGQEKGTVQVVYLLFTYSSLIVW